METMTEHTLALYRDSPSRPWGFRLYHLDDSCYGPYRVQRIHAQSPSDGQLKSGDEITEIDGQLLNALTYFEVKEILQYPTDRITLRILRNESSKTVKPVEMRSKNFVGKQNPSRRCNKMESLPAHRTDTSGTTYDENDNEIFHSSVLERQRLFSRPTESKSYYSQNRTNNRPLSSDLVATKFNKPVNPAFNQNFVFGWAPSQELFENVSAPGGQRISAAAAESNASYDEYLASMFGNGRHRQNTPSPQQKTMPEWDVLHKRQDEQRHARAQSLVLDSRQLSPRPPLPPQSAHLQSSRDHVHKLHHHNQSTQSHVHTLHDHGHSTHGHVHTLHDHGHSTHGPVHMLHDHGHLTHGHVYTLHNHNHPVVDHVHPEHNFVESARVRVKPQHGKVHTSQGPLGAFTIQRTIANVALSKQPRTRSVRQRHSLDYERYGGDLKMENFYDSDREVKSFCLPTHVSIHPAGRIQQNIVISNRKSYTHSGDARFRCADEELVDSVQQPRGYPHRHASVNEHGNYHRTHYYHHDHDFSQDFGNAIPDGNNNATFDRTVIYSSPFYNKNEFEKSKTLGNKPFANEKSNSYDFAKNKGEWSATDINKASQQLGDATTDF